MIEENSRMEKGGTKLVIGAGNKYMGKEYTRLDNDPAAKPDILYDLTQFPWPFKSDSVEEIIAEDVLEHLPNIPRTMAEVYRILKKGGTIQIDCPYAHSFGAFEDPSHVHYLMPESFEAFFTVKGDMRRMGGGKLFTLEKIHLEKNSKLKWMPASLLKFIMNGIVEFTVILKK